MSYGAAVIILAGGEWIQASDPARVASTATNQPRESGERLQGEIAAAINIKAAGSSEVK